MIRKIIVFTLMMVFVLFNIVSVYGAEYENSINRIGLLYEQTASYSTNFDIDSIGKAEIKGTLRLLGLSNADKGRYRL